MKSRIIMLVLLAASFAAFGQSADAYDGEQKGQSAGLLDPTRFSIHHGMSFGMASGGGLDGVKSQSLYTTMMQYKFASPVTLNLNFGMPIHSTFSSAQNLTTSNIESLHYFRNMPIDASLTWRPRDNLLMRFSVVNRTESAFVRDNLFSDYSNEMFGTMPRVP